VSDLSRLLANATTPHDPTPFTTALTNWDRVVPRWAYDRLLEVIMHDYDTEDRGDGSGRLRPSSLKHSCDRLKLLSFLGERAERTDVVLDGMADSGTWLHYKFQLEGLACGYLQDIEVPVVYEPYLTAGSADGMDHDGIPLEVKSMTASKYHRAVKVHGEPVMFKEYVFQTHIVMKATGADRCTVIYVNRDNANAWTEFTMRWNDRVAAELDTMMARLVPHAQAGSLPARLPGCEAMTGDVYAKCDFRKACFRHA
jgi:hypothetical protein